MKTNDNSNSFDGANILTLIKFLFLTNTILIIIIQSFGKFPLFAILFYLIILAAFKSYQNKWDKSLKIVLGIIIPLFAFVAFLFNKLYLLSSVDITNYILPILIYQALLAIPYLLFRSDTRLLIYNLCFIWFLMIIYEPVNWIFGVAMTQKLSYISLSDSLRIMIIFVLASIIINYSAGMLFIRVRKDQRQMSDIIDFSTQLRSAKSKDEVIDMLFNFLKDSKSLNDLVIYSYNRVEDRLTVKNSLTSGGGLRLDSTVNDSYLAKKGIVTKAIMEKKIVYVSDTSKDDFYVTDKIDAQSELVIPGMVHDEIDYVIDFEHPKKNAFSDYFINYVTTVNNIVVQHLLLLESTQNIRDLNKSMTLLMITQKTLGFELVKGSNQLHFFPKKVFSDSFGERNFQTIDWLKDKIHPQQRSSFLSKCNLFLNEEIDSMESHFQMFTKEGTTWKRFITNRLRDGSIRGLILDIEGEKTRESLEIKAQEEERARIAREIHDGIGQMIYGTRVLIKGSLGGVEERLAEVDKILETVIFETRVIINNLNSTILNDQDFPTCIETLIDNTKKFYPGNIDFNWVGPREIIEMKLKINIFRMLQEALSNSIRHSKADRIVINIDNEQTLKIIYEDNGVGFDLEKVDHGFGLTNIKKRAKELNADLKIISKPNNGMSLEFTLIPVA